MSTSGICNVYVNLTPAEKQFIEEHPLAAWHFWQDAAKAIREACRRYPTEIHNGRGDAFRHAYWSALMTKHCGPLLASKFGFAHEAVPPGDGEHSVLVGTRCLTTQPRPEREMDQYNNAVGRHIALSNLGAQDGQLAEEVEHALKIGQLRCRP